MDNIVLILAQIYPSLYPGGGGGGGGGILKIFFKLCSMLGDSNK